MACSGVSQSDCMLIRDCVFKAFIAGTQTQDQLHGDYIDVARACSFAVISLQ